MLFFNRKVVLLHLDEASLEFQGGEVRLGMFVQGVHGPQHGVVAAIAAKTSLRHS